MIVFYNLNSSQTISLKYLLEATMKYRFIASISGRYKTVHDLKQSTKQCQIDRMEISKTIRFASLDAAIIMKFKPCYLCVKKE